MNNENQKYLQDNGRRKKRESKEAVASAGSLGSATLSRHLDCSCYWENSTSLTLFVHFHSGQVSGPRVSWKVKDSHHFKASTSQIHLIFP